MTSIGVWSFRIVREALGVCGGLGFRADDFVFFSFFFGGGRGLGVPLKGAVGVGPFRMSGLIAGLGPFGFRVFSGGFGVLGFKGCRYRPFKRSLYMDILALRF